MMYFCRFPNNIVRIYDAKSRRDEVVLVQSLYKNPEQELMVVGKLFQSSPFFMTPYDSTEIGIYKCRLPRRQETANVGVWKFEQVNGKFFPLPTKLEETFDANNTAQEWVMTIMRHSEM